MVVLGRLKFLMSEVPLYEPARTSAGSAHMPRSAPRARNLLSLSGESINQDIDSSSRQVENRPTITEIDLWREFFIDNLLVRIYHIIVMIRWTGLAPWGFEFSFPGCLTSTFLIDLHNLITQSSMVMSFIYGKDIDE